MNAHATAAALSAARAAFYEAGPRPSLRAIAEEHGLSYGRLLRVAKEQEWEKNSRIAFLRRRIAEHTEELAQKKSEAARAAKKLLTAIERGSSLQALRMLSGLAEYTTGDVQCEVVLLASFRAELDERLSGKTDSNPLSAFDRLGWKHPSNVVNERNRRRWERRATRNAA